MTEESKKAIFCDKPSDDLQYIKKQLVYGADAAQRNGQPKIAELLFAAAAMALRNSTSVGKERTIVYLNIYYSKFLVEQGKVGKARRVSLEAVTIAKSSGQTPFIIAAATNNYAAACRRGRTKKLQETARAAYLEVATLLETIREIPSEKYMQNCLVMFDRAVGFFKDRGDESTVEQLVFRSEVFKNSFRRLPENTLFVRSETFAVEERNRLVDLALDRSLAAKNAEALRRKLEEQGQG
jgi:hypothetical protein